MTKNYDIHPNAPAFSSGAGAFRSAAPIGTNLNMDKWMRPGPLGADHKETAEKPQINGVVIEGGPLSQTTIAAINKAAAKIPLQWRRFIAYSDKVKVGGSLAWRANNPGNLRTAPTKIGEVSGAIGNFAVFASLKEGRSAQRDLYVSKYGEMNVRDAINKLTPPSENDTENYLAQLKAAGVDLDKDVKSQIDALMAAVETNEGLIQGIEIERAP